MAQVAIRSNDSSCAPCGAKLDIGDRYCGQCGAQMWWDDTPAFLFDGDHGDEPQPNQVMTWSQWDDLPLAVINHDGRYLACIVVKDDCEASREAIHAARTQLRDWLDADRDAQHVGHELHAIRDGLDCTLDMIDHAKAFGYNDRVDDYIESLGAIAGQLSELVQPQA